jgi:hypothetical protein
MLVKGKPSERVGRKATGLNPRGRKGGRAVGRDRHLLTTSRLAIFKGDEINGGVGLSVLFSLLNAVYNCYIFCRSLLSTKRLTVKGSRPKAQGSRFKPNHRNKTIIAARNNRASSRVPCALRPVPFIILACALSLAPCAAARAATVTIAWNQNPESDIAGYKIHYGTFSGIYQHDVDVGNHTSCTISSLAEGTKYFFSATAYNSENTESDFSEEITYTPGSEPDPPAETLDEVIIDNGDDSAYFTGRWRISGCPNPYGSNSVYSTGWGSRYTYEAALKGDYVVSLWWTEHRTSRCSGVPVEIYDGITLLETILVNQQANGGQWNELGEYSFNGTAKVTIVSEGGCITGADAVEFALNNDPAPSIYLIAASAGTGGSISPAGEVTISPGSSATYTIQPNTNYHIADVIVDGTSVGPVASYTFKNLDANHTITVSFDADADDTSSSTFSSGRWWQRYFYRWF